MSVLILIGAVMWVEVFEKLVDVQSNANPMAIQFRQTMDELNRFMVHAALP